VSSYYHSNCGGSVYLNLSNLILFISSFTPGKQYVRIGMGDLTFKESEKTTFPAKFFCSKCESGEISSGSLYSYCSNCGKNFKVSELEKVTETGGIYCNSCVKTISASDPIFANSSKILLINLLSKVSTKR